MIHVWHWYCGLVTTTLAWLLSANEDHLNGYSLFVLLIGCVVNEIIHYFVKDRSERGE